MSFKKKLVSTGTSSVNLNIFQIKYICCHVNILRPDAAISTVPSRKQRLYTHTMSTHWSAATHSTGRRLPGDCFGVRLRSYLYLSTLPRFQEVNVKYSHPCWKRLFVPLTEVPGDYLSSHVLRLRYSNQSVYDVPTGDLRSRHFTLSIDLIKSYLSNWWVLTTTSISRQNC